MRDTDRLLRTHPLFQLGHYLRGARAAGADERERAQWEQNARRLITLWGGPGSPLFGYAQRQYGGLMSDYNLPAWKLFLESAAGALREGRPFDVRAADAAVRSYTEAWIHRRDEYPEEAEGDTIEAARRIADTYLAGELPAVWPPVVQAIVGRWRYAAGGKNYVREFREDGSLHLYVDGVEQTAWKGYTWTAQSGEIACRKADGSIFGRHRFRDPQTLLFLNEPFGPAVRDIRHRD